MKLKLKEKLEIIAMYENGYTMPMISKRFKVGETSVKKIERQY